MNEENANAADNPTPAQGTPTPVARKSIWKNPWLWGVIGGGLGVGLGFLIKKRPTIITAAAPAVSDAVTQGLMAIL